MKLKTIMIFLILVLLVILVYLGISNNNGGIEILSQVVEEDINTELLQIQAKVKVLSEQSIIKDDENILLGEKLETSENEENKQIFIDLKNNSIIQEDDENIEKYYIWNRDILNELNLSLNLNNVNNIVINYSTFDVIIPSGFKLKKDGEILYKLSDIKKE